MSRSRRPQCSTGRGCQCCGDESEVRRARETQGLDAIPAGIEEVSDGWHDGDLSDLPCDCEWCCDPVDGFDVPGVEFKRAA